MPGRPDSHLGLHAEGCKPCWSRPDKEDAVPVKVAVCVKQVPDPSQPPALDPATRNLVRDGKVVMDDADGHGVELGLQLTAAGGEVVIVSMAPGEEVAGLRPALAM